MLDLRELAPEMFSKTDSISHTMGKIWRRACDVVLCENRGAYAHIGGTKVKIFFYDLVAGAGKIRVDAIRRRITDFTKMVQEGKELPELPLPGVKKQTETPPSNPEMGKVLKEGLGANPTIEEVRVWSTRTMQNLIHGGQKMPLTREMVDLAIKSDISYMPFWNASTQALMGSLGTVKGSIPPQQYDTGEVARQDLALLFGSCMQLYTMQSKGRNGMVVLPVRFQTLADRDVCALYITILGNVSIEVKKSLIIEVRGTPKDSVPTGLVASLDTISRFVRAFVLETNAISFIDYGKSLPRLHACGFDCADAASGEGEKIRLLQKYAESCRQMGMKYYVTNIDSIDLLEAAVQSGYTYVSGPVIRPQQKLCWAVQKLSLDEIRGDGQEASG